MKRFILLITLFLPMMFVSCTEKDDGVFTIIGKWGMVSGTITDSDGSTKRYEALGDGVYYQYYEFKVDGTLIKTTWPENTVYYGVYTFNDATKELSYKYDGDKYYYPGIISVISAREMNLTTDYGSSGRITQYFTKLK